MDEKYDLCIGRSAPSPLASPHVSRIFRRGSRHGELVAGRPYGTFSGWGAPGVRFGPLGPERGDNCIRRARLFSRFCGAPKLALLLRLVLVVVVVLLLSKGSATAAGPLPDNV